MLKHNGYRPSATGKDPLRQYQGAVSRAQGKRFEKYIEMALRYYEQQGKAVIEKTPEPMVVTKNLGNGKFIAFFEKAAQPDYKGTVKGGKTIVFEAKYTDAEKIDQSRVTPEQVERLDKHYAMGAECFVIVGFGNGDFFRVPWSIWRNMKACFGHKYATPTELEPYRVFSDRDGVMLILD